MGSKVRNPIVIIAFSGVLWGTSFVAMKVGLGYVDPYSFAFLRLLLAFVFSVVLLRSGQRPRVDMLRDWRVWALGVLNGGGFILQYVGIALTTATRTAPLTQSNVVVTALVSWRLLGEPMGLTNFIALPLAILGVFLLVTGGDLSTLSGGQAAGDLLVILAGWM
jgi:drug/metabolite transporter (DMT)-like permease